MLYPLTFAPVFKERLWGGRSLQRLYGKALPANLPIGESWEICDRSSDVSVVNRGPLAGQNLHELLQHDRDALLGPAGGRAGHFPLLVKILDAEERLSLQVHPPAEVAQRLHGEPKTEMWFLVEARPGAELYAGLKRGVDRQHFEERLRHGMVADCVHRLPVRTGDAMLVPSGRVHGIGAGCVIFEIQQNSDTTYRVFDWNRVGPDGKARELHVGPSLDSIDFTDIEPGLVDSAYRAGAGIEVRPLVSCAYFEADVRRLGHGATAELTGAPLVLGVVTGRLEVQHDSCPASLSVGEFCLIPACLERVAVRAGSAAEFLTIRVL